MKTLVGLPALPSRHWWRIRQAQQSDAILVEICRFDANDHPEVLVYDLTRSFPRPNGTSVVRTAKRLHRRWMITNATPHVEELRKAS
jgi:hypothetical protein